jgi:hypothetical protein
VVQQLAPLGALGELQRAGALDQRVGIAAVGGGGAREEQQQEKKALWQTPQGSCLRVQLA